MEPAGARVVIAYACAIIGASLAFVVITDIVGFFRGALSTVYPLSTRLYQWAWLSLFTFLIIAFCAFFTALIPVIVAHRIANRFSIRSIWYYVVAGAMTGLILSPIAVLVRPRMFWDVPPEPSFYEEIFNIARFIVPSGAVGGLAYWWQAGRFIGGEDHRVH